MALPRETVHLGAPHPGTPIEVMRSGAGFYVGFRDVDGSPYSRETGYFPTKEKAELVRIQLLEGEGGHHYRTSSYNGN